jgi:choline kinase
MENKILRQSSKIYDYTQYLISKDQQAINKEISFKKNLIKFCKCFPNFRNIVERRQKQILISLTSYKERFNFLPTVINSLKSQSITPNKIVLVLAEKDMNSYDLKIEGLDIITINKDLRSHNKYYYAMLKYPEYAIVTVDDDIIYCKNMLERLYNSYIDHPNIVSGRRGHLMRYKKNGELESYYSWNMDQKSIIEADYNIFLTGVGGVLYPPDVFNINEQYSKIIEETMTADDIALKYYEVMKGIDEKWVPNNHIYLF